MTFFQFFLLNASDGPSTPWGTPGLAMQDTLRVIICVFAFLILGITPVTVKRANTIGQKARLLGSAFYAVIACLTEYSHIGDFGNWRLAVNLIATAFVSWGLWSAIFYEKASTYSLNAVDRERK